METFAQNASSRDGSSSKLNWNPRDLLTKLGFPTGSASGFHKDVQSGKPYVLGAVETVPDGFMGYFTNSSSSDGLSLTKALVRLASPSMDAPFSTTSKSFDPEGGMLTVGNANPAGLRIPKAIICPFAQDRGAGGLENEIEGRTNLRIWDRPDAGSLAVTSMFSKGPSAMRRATDFPELSCSSCRVCVVSSSIVGQWCGDDVL